MAHLVAGEAAFRDLDLDVVTFIPAGAPWQKADKGVSAAEHRWAMTRLAIDGVGYFQADDREVIRDGWTYTADTLDGFDASDELFLILGADAAAGLPSWHRYEDVIERASLAVMPRGGTDASAVEAVGDVHWLSAPTVGISGTMLRARRRRGLSNRFLVRDAVLAYIEENRLYVT